MAVTIAPNETAVAESVNRNALRARGGSASSTKRASSAGSGTGDGTGTISAARKIAAPSIRRGNDSHRIHRSTGQRRPTLHGPRKARSVSASPASNAKDAAGGDGAEAGIGTSSGSRKLRAGNPAAARSRNATVKGRKPKGRRRPGIWTHPGVLHRQWASRQKPQ